MGYYAGGVEMHKIVSQNDRRKMILFPLKSLLERRKKQEEETRNLLHPAKEVLVFGKILVLK
jgi:hypothetical protein